MRIEQAIEHTLEVYIKNPECKCNKEHLQLAKWLIELKSLRKSHPGSSKMTRWWMQFYITKLLRKMRRNHGHESSTSR